MDLALDAVIEKTEKKKGIYEKPQDHQETHGKPVKNQQAKEAPNYPSSEAWNNPPTEAVMPEFPTQSFAIRSSRYIPRQVRKFVLKRADHQCEHVHKNGERCHSKFQIQYDHIKAFSKGRESNIENIQLLCRVHNAYKGTQCQHSGS